MLNQDKNQQNDPAQKPAKPVDENLGILVEDHVRITDPATQELLYRGRG